MYKPTPEEKKFKKDMEDKVRAQKHKELARFYNLCSMLGNDWAIFYAIIGARMTGKSYAVADWLCQRKAKLGPMLKIYWLRISETSTKAMLANGADKLIDPDLIRKYNLNLKTKGSSVFDCDNDGSPVAQFMECIPLSMFAKLKGVGFYDKDFTGEYAIVLDEFQTEQGEKRTSFDILYNFIGMCENIARTTKKKIRIFLLSNTLSEAGSILKAFNFVPDKFGRFYLHSKRCVIDNLEPTKEYKQDRKGSIADILGGDSMSNFTNEIKHDIKLIVKERVKRPSYMIKFSNSPQDWFVVWDTNIIKRWKNQNIPKNKTIHMRPYMDAQFNMESRNNVIEAFDLEAFKFDSLITYTYFKEALTLIRKK